MRDKTARLAGFISLIRSQQQGIWLTDETGLIDGCFSREVELRTNHLIISCRSRSEAKWLTFPAQRPMNNMAVVVVFLV